MTVINGLIRSIPFFLIFLITRFLPVPADVVGENIRLGLIVFGLTGVICAVWALVDSLSRPLARTLLTWLVAAIIISLSQPLLGRAEAGTTYNAADAQHDLANLSVFMFGLVLLPAAVMALGAHRWLVHPAAAPEPATNVIDLRQPTAAAHLRSRSGPAHRRSTSRAARRGGRHARRPGGAPQVAVPEAPATEAPVTTGQQAAVIPYRGRHARPTVPDAPPHNSGAAHRAV